MSARSTVTIDRFLGLNKSATETMLKPGEASSMKNWMITDDGKLRKMYGYHRLNSIGGSVRGIWFGSLNGTDYLLYAKNGHVYNQNMTTNVDTDLGSIANAYPTTFFVTNNTVYIMDGTDLYQWTGTGSISTVVGYVPTVYSSSPPSGGGQMLELINYITGKKTQLFSANGDAVLYRLAEMNVESVNAVYVNGYIKTQGTDYTVSTTDGTVTFVTAPTEGTDNVSITWTKTTSGDRQVITNNRYYGGSFASRFWIYGNPSYKNTRYCTGVTPAGVSDPTYWGKYAESNVGEYEITAMLTQYEKQLIFTAGDTSGASAWYSTYEAYIDSSTGIQVTIFPVYPISSKVGNVAKGQVQLVVNNPFTVWKGIYQWVSTYVANEKNAQWLSARIQPDLDSIDLKNAITWDWSSQGTYLMAIGSKVWAYNYRVDAWYMLELPHTITAFANVGSDLYFGTSNGYLMKFDKDDHTFDGAVIESSWEMGFFNFGSEWITKFINELFVSIKPEARSYLAIKYATDRNSSSDTYEVINILATFEDMNFGSLSFRTNYNPQPYKYKIRAKKIDYFKLILISDNADPCTVISLTIPVRTGGEVNRRY